LTALAMPVMSPPPPTGTTTVSTSERSSISSSPMVPFPAITPSSSTAWMNRPSCPSKRCVSITSHQSSNGIGTTCPPRRAIAESFACGAVSGTAIVAGTPSSRAAYATPCAMLPALAVTSPRATASRGAAIAAL
jgi:hypothetical protein